MGLSLIKYSKNLIFWFPLSLNTQQYILVHTLSPFPYMHTQNNLLWKKKN